ncbi:hypothetical protein SUGI_0655680 [Cryptomeria japonica]|uniref:exocyst complex component EXO70A1 n=1 Tax=Cryptomeria japonica TaxID=3369 RepID=UPI002414C5FF|nr:exocyst complex component EXO70A1 [Cryptomeria japonica]GLJ32585.1 hypothetical protein SUGI_0655680 [Cryptomeria japonica]
MLTSFELNTFQGLLSAQKSLLKSTHNAKQIGQSIHKCGHNLQLMKQRREDLESVVAPLLSLSRESQNLIKCIKNAVASAVEVLAAMMSVRELRNTLVGDDPGASVEGYLGAALKLEGYLNFVAENLPLALSQLEEAVRVSNSSPLVDEYTMERLNNCIEALWRNSKEGDHDGDSKRLLDMAAQKLESSFNLVLTDFTVSYRKTSELLTSQGEQTLNFDVFMNGNLKTVKEIAQFLKRNGRAQQCFKMYWDVRVRIVKDSFQNMRPYYLSYNSENLKGLDWADLEGQFSDWLALLDVGVRELLWPERQLCYQIFEGFDEEAWTRCFGKLALVGGMDELIRFGEAIVASQREPQMVFKLLDTFERLENLKGDLEKVFGGYGCMETRLRFRELQKQLAHSCCQVLLGFTKKVEEDSGFPADGDLLKITRYVVNYLKFLVGEYRLVMVWVLEMEGMENPEMKLSQMVEDVFSALERSLEGRSKGYAEPALAHLFLMNNYWYIFKRVRDSELAFLGEMWLKERKRWVNQQLLGYEKHEWGPVLVHMNREGLAASTGSRGATKELFKQRLSAFNSALDHIREAHRHWVISDDDLREGTLVKITQVLVPAYRNFTETYGHLLDNNANRNRYLRYTPEKLEDLLANIFSEKSHDMPNEVEFT